MAPWSGLEKETEKCAAIIEDFCAGDDPFIPKEVMALAQGLVIFTQAKVGFFFGLKFGDGIMVRRNLQNQWSAPSLVNVGGGSFGAQAGLEYTTCVMVLSDKEAVQCFMLENEVMTGVQLGIAVGPVGRDLESDFDWSSLASVVTYCKSKGVYAGLTFEGSLISTRNSANKKFYGADVCNIDILNSTLRPVEEDDADDQVGGGGGGGSGGRSSGGYSQLQSPAKLTKLYAALGQVPKIRFMLPRYSIISDDAVLFVPATHVATVVTRTEGAVPAYLPEGTIVRKEKTAYVDAAGGVNSVERTTYIPPAIPRRVEDPTLPKDWVALVDERSGRVYYQNQETHATQWKHPGLEKPPEYAEKAPSADNKQ